MVSLCEMNGSSRRPDNTCDSCSRDDNRGYKHDRHPACLMDLRSEAARLHTTYSPNSRQEKDRGRAQAVLQGLKNKNTGRRPRCVSLDSTELTLLCLPGNARATARFIHLLFLTISRQKILSFVCGSGPSTACTTSRCRRHRRHTYSHRRSCR